jgi:uncharacterized protein (DUF1810 family)
MWFCFPTPPYMVNGVEQGSARNRMYAIRTDEEAHDFLTFDADGVNLRQNYLQICIATRDKLKDGHTAKSIFGFIDEPKLKSSVAYFEGITAGGVDDNLNGVLKELMTLLGLRPAATTSTDKVPKRSKSQPSVGGARRLQQSTSGPRRLSEQQLHLHQREQHEVASDTNGSAASDADRSLLRVVASPQRTRTPSPRKQPGAQGGTDKRKQVLGMRR